jgi:hypothetical protein
MKRQEPMPRHELTVTDAIFILVLMTGIALFFATNVSADPLWFAR